MRRIKLVMCGGKKDRRGSCLPEGMNEKFGLDFPSWPDDLDVSFHIVDTLGKYKDLMLFYDKWRLDGNFYMCDLASLEFHLIIKPQNQRKNNTPEELALFYNQPDVKAETLGFWEEFETDVIEIEDDAEYALFLMMAQ